MTTENDTPKAPDAIGQYWWARVGAMPKEVVFITDFTPYSKMLCFMRIGRHESFTDFNGFVEWIERVQIPESVSA